MHSLSKCRRALLIAAVLCLPGIAVLSPAQQSPQLYPVRGVVLNTLTHQPIPRVLVDGNIDAALTDGDGRFELNLPEGVGQIQVRRPGYNARGLEVSHSVNIGANLPAFTFYLTPQASITGHVTLSSGDDSDGIRFMVYMRHTVNGHQKWIRAGGAVTNTEGVFHVTNLETPGVYVLCSIPAQDTNARTFAIPRPGPRSIGKAAGGTTGYPSVCYPGPISASADSANLLAISPGQQPEFELTLNRQPFYLVSIAVPNAPRKQPVGVQIFDSSGRPLEYSASWNQQRETAEVNLPNGQYYAEAYARGETASYGRVDFNVSNAPVFGLSMILLTLHSLPVEVRREFTVNTGNSSPQPQNRFIGMSGITEDQYNPGVNLVLTPADSGIGDSIGSGLTHRKGSTDKSLFDLNDVVPGRYWVQSMSYQGYVGSITSGGVDLTREPLVVGPGNAAAPIQIVLRDDGGQIHCTVNPATAPVAGSPVGEMTFSFVYAIPQFPTGAQIPQTASQVPGPAVLANLAPGSYRVFAVDKPMEIDGADSKELARLSGLGKEVTVEAGGVVNLELDLIRTGSAEVQEGSTP